MMYMYDYQINEKARPKLSYIFISNLPDGLKLGTLFTPFEQVGTVNGASVSPYLFVFITYCLNLRL
jgi:hypothetical protein